MAEVEDNLKDEGRHTVRGPSHADKEATFEAKDRDMQVLLANKHPVEESDKSILREEITPVPTALETLEVTNNSADHKNQSTAGASKVRVDANKYNNRKLFFKLRRLKLSELTTSQRKSFDSSRRYVECKKHHMRNCHVRVERMVSIADTLEEYLRNSEIKKDLHKHVKLNTTMEAQPKTIGVFTDTSKNRKSCDTEITNVTQEAFKMIPEVTYKIPGTDSKTSQVHNEAISRLIEGLNKAFGEYNKTVIEFNSSPAVMNKEYKPIICAPIISISTATSHAPTATYPGTSTQTRWISNVLCQAQENGNNNRSRDVSNKAHKVSNKTPEVSNKTLEVINKTPEMSNKTPVVGNKTPEIINKINKEDAQRKVNSDKLVKNKGEMFQGTMDPISIFPEEIWEMILDQVSSLDRLATCRTNTQLDTAFGECKNEWLFDQVLPFLLKHFSEQAHMLKCRQVCKNWRRTVNSFLESEHPLRRVYQKNHPVENLFCRMPSAYSNLGRCSLPYIRFTPKNPDKFSNCLEPNKPLVGRAVSFVMYDNPFPETDPNITEFCLQARTFLSLQGENIWHFQFLFCIGVCSPESWYKTLWECLKLLPNLRTLEISWVPRGMNFRIIQEIFAKLIAVNPLPVPPRLHSLHMENVPTVIQQHMVQLSKHLKSLCIEVFHVNDLPYVFQSGSNLMANLVEIWVCVSKDDTDTLRRLHTMNTLTGPKCCQKLTLDLRLDRSVSGLELLALLGQYPQLSQVRLFLHPASLYVKECPVCSGCPVLSGVEYLEIKGSKEDLVRFSKLFHRFPNLKYLHIQHADSPLCYADRERYHCSHKLEESPIWDTLNQLEVFTFESFYFRELRRRFCSREQVKYYRERYTGSGDLDLCGWFF